MKFYLTVFLYLISIKTHAADASEYVLTIYPSGQSNTFDDVQDHQLRDVENPSDNVESWLHDRDTSLNLDLIINYAKTRNTNLYELLKAKLSFLYESEQLIAAKGSQNPSLSEIQQRINNKIILLDKTGDSALKDIEKREQTHPYRRELLNLFHMMKFYREKYTEVYQCLLAEHEQNKLKKTKLKQPELREPVGDENIKTEDYNVEIIKILNIFNYKYSEILKNIFDELGGLTLEEQKRKTKIDPCHLLRGIIETLPKSLQKQTLDRELKCSIM
jgi:hypothetical protein